MDAPLPWTGVNDILLEIEAAGSPREMVQKIIDCVPRIISVDLPCVFGAVEPGKRLLEDQTYVESRKWYACFRDRYWNIVPDLSGEKGKNAKLVDWNRYKDTEYACDFMKPQKIRYSLGVTLGVPSLCLVGTFALNRSARSRPFSENDLRIMEILQPHLRNLYGILGRDARSPLSALSERYGVTARELEVVERLLRGFSNGRIASELGLSERTVESHCLHVYHKLGVSDRVELLVLSSRLRISVPAPMKKP
jgi:DNA-binding CsgD family transcriptional regulator